MTTILDRIAATPPSAGNLTVATLHRTEVHPLPEVHRRAGQVARFLLDLGVRPGDRIGILADNGLAWVLLDLAALRLKVQTAGFDPGKFAPTPDLVDRYDLALLFTDRATDAGGPRTLPASRVLELPPDDAFDPLPPVSWQPEDVTTIKFTSGSTGEPKGLGATAGSIHSSLSAVQELFHHTRGDDLFVFLSLSLLQQRYWVYSALAHGHGLTLTTPEAAFATLPRTEPTVVMGIPAFFDNARRTITNRMARTTPRPALAEAARTVFGRRIRYLWTGSAPAAPDVLAFYEEAGLPLYEGYGLNETCIVTKNHPGAHRIGSVGKPLPGKRVHVDADGHITVESDHPVNTRYAYARPGDSERMFGPGNTVRTGDIGHLDEDGFLYVHGRADDTIVLTNGRKIVVRPIEERLKRHPAIAEAVLYCPHQTHLVAVVSPSGAPPDIDAITTHLKDANASLTADQQVHRVIVADPPFTPDNGLLTHQYKPRRRQILDTYLDAVNDPREGIRAS
ncbi:AMP-binding protein [Streptomyces sp. NPDC047315]|uniref:AMP-binding protein n=1 Tax=Streptomyces sp. NPDC047315 TaxID=3155142 RepID=UPI0033D844C2